MIDEVTVTLKERRERSDCHPVKVYVSPLQKSQGPVGRIKLCVFGLQIGCFFQGVS